MKLFLAVCITSMIGCLTYIIGTCTLKDYTDDMYDISFTNAKIAFIVYMFLGVISVVTFILMIITQYLL